MRINTRTILDYLIICLNPQFWGMLYEYDDEYDKFINNLMQKHYFASVHYKTNYTLSYGYTAFLDDTEIWICNYPFAFGVLHGDSKNRFARSCTVRPSRLTILRMKRKLKYDLKNECINFAEYKI